jgi:hypothetical protein
MLPVTRHELAVFLVPLGLYFLFRRDWLAAMLLGWAEIAWNLLAWSTGLPVPLHRFFSGLGPQQLGEGDVLHYAKRWLEMSGVVVTSLTAAGVALLIGRAAREFIRASAAPGHRWSAGRTGLRSRGQRDPKSLRLMIALGALGLVLLETVLYAHNRFASGGYARFLLPAAPWMALCAGYALEPLVQSLAGRGRSSDTRRPPWPLLLAAAVLGLACYHRQPTQPVNWIVLVVGGAVAAAVIWRARWTAAIGLFGLMLLAIAQWAPLASPHRMGPHQVLLGQVIDTIQRQHPDSHILGHTPWVLYFAQNVPSEYGRVRSGADIWEAAVDPPVDVFYLYDSAHAYSTPLSRITSHPHECVGVYWVHSTDPEPFLRVYRRLPGQ